VSFGGKLSKHNVPCPTEQDWRKGRVVDRFIVSRGVVLESPAVIGKVSEHELTETPRAKESHYQQGRTDSLPVDRSLFRKALP